MVKVCIGLLASCATPKYRAQIENCKTTWAKDAAKLGIPVHFFCGSSRSFVHPDTDLDPVANIAPRLIHFPNVGDDYMSATYKQWYGLRFLYTVYSDYDFFVIAGTDNYVDCSNLLEELIYLDPTKPLYIGGHTGRQDVGYKITFHFGGGGIILSKAAMRELDVTGKADTYIEEWIEKCKTLSNGKELTAACDVALAFFSERVNLGFVTLTGMYACNWMGKLEGRHCCYLNYPVLITCHFMEDNMKLYHSLKDELKKEWYRNRLILNYTLANNIPSNLSSHVSSLYRLASDCESVLQIRKRPSISCIPFLRALHDNKEAVFASVYSIDEEKPQKHLIPVPFLDVKICDPISEIPIIAKGLGICYDTTYGDPLTFPLPMVSVDILFIEADDVRNLVTKIQRYVSIVHRYIIVHSISRVNHDAIKVISTLATASNFIVIGPPLDDLTILKKVNSSNTVVSP